MGQWGASVSRHARNRSPNVFGHSLYFRGGRVLGPRSTSRRGRRPIGVDGRSMQAPCQTPPGRHSP
eukprot:13968739-Alexandrium_andersonii.AAC.1